MRNAIPETDDLGFWQVIELCEELAGQCRSVLLSVRTEAEQQAAAAVLFSRFSESDVSSVSRISIVRHASGGVVRILTERMPSDSSLSIDDVVLLRSGDLPPGHKRGLGRSCNLWVPETIH